MNKWLTNAINHAGRPEQKIEIAERFMNDIDNPSNSMNSNYQTFVPQISETLNTQTLNRNGFNEPLSIKTKSGTLMLPSPSTVICRGNLPKKAVEGLKKWLFEHFNHPYPSESEKDQLAKQTSTKFSLF